ncbi:MAG: GNAT family N-acetyltransferase [Candidatus Limnocylindria bacterium]
MHELPAGFTTRPVRPGADIPALLDLAQVAAVAEYGVADVDERLVREAHNLPSFAVETDSHLVLDERGEAAGIAEFYDGEEIHVAPYLFVRVRPERLATTVPDALLAWGTERAAGNLHLAPEGARVAVHTDVASVNLPMIAALQRSGWRHERTSWRMEIDLEAAATLPEPVWPPGIRVRSADLERDGRAIHAAENDAFSDHYGFVPQPFDEWWHFRTRFLRAEPELWILAMDGEGIAGMALCSSQRPGEPDLGWVSTLGVRRAWRRRGLALAILRHAFRELAARGRPRAGLGVDAQNLTGATRLYERAGMRVVRESHEYEIVIRDGRDLRTTSLDPAPPDPGPTPP